MKRTRSSRFPVEVSGTPPAYLIVACRKMRTRVKRLSYGQHLPNGEWGYEVSLREGWVSYEGGDAIRSPSGDGAIIQLNRARFIGVSAAERSAA